MKTAKRKASAEQSKGFIYLSILLVMCSLLLTTCDVLPANPENDLPSGKGYFTLNLSDSVGRTVLPATPALSYFDRFQLIFTQGVTEVENIANAAMGAGNKLAPVLLTAGTYDITVNAYKTVGGTDRLAATGVRTNFTVVQRQDNEALITLTALLTGSGTGTITYNISFTGLTGLNNLTGSLAMVNSAGTAVSASYPMALSNLTGALTGELPNLPVGVYTATLNLIQPGISGAPDVRAFKWSEVIHVYSTLTSAWNRTINDAFFNATSYTITFNDNYTGGGTAAQSYLHGDTLQNANPQNRQRDTFTLDCWLIAPSCPPPCTERVCDPSCTNRWNTATQIIEGRTLYAKWYRTAAVIEVDVGDIPEIEWNYTLSNPAVVLAPANIITLSRSGAGGLSVSVNLTINTADYDPGSVVWEVFGAGVYADVTVNNAATFTLNAANNSYNTIGRHTLRLTVSKGGTKFMLNIPFEIRM